MSCNAESHKMHICYLTLHGDEESIMRISDNPTVECQHCGAKANSLEYICAAHLGKEAPSVEGGHGTVPLDEIGKPHSGQQTDN